MSVHSTTPVPVNRPTCGRLHPFRQRPCHERRVRALWIAHSSYLPWLIAIAALAGFFGPIYGNSLAFAEPQEATEVAPPVPAYPEQPMPSDGEVKSFTGQERIAPFEIKAAAGSNYLVKLADAASNAAVMTIFVRGGSTIRVDVPLGNYELKYAAGEQWYGYDHLFGPKTGYSKADTTLNFIRTGNQVSGYSVTLYAVPGGNLSTKRIDASEF